MVNITDVSIDTVALALSLGVAFFAFEIRNKFRGGIMWKPWRIIGPSPVLFSFAQAIHILQEVFGPVAVLEIARAAFIFGFILMLFYGFYLFNKVWTPRAAS